MKNLKKYLFTLIIAILATSANVFACNPSTDPGCTDSASAFGNLTGAGEWQVGDLNSNGSIAMNEAYLCGMVNGTKIATYEGTITGNNLGNVETDGTTWAKSLIELNGKGTFDTGNATITGGAIVKEGSIASETNSSTSYRIGFQTSGATLPEKTVTTESGGQLTFSEKLSAMGSTGGKIDITNNIVNAYANNTAEGGSPYANNNVGVGMMRDIAVGSSVIKLSGEGIGNGNSVCLTGTTGTEGTTSVSLPVTTTVNGISFQAITNTSERIKRN